MIVSVVSLIIGIVSMLYFISYMMLVGANNSFTYVWALLGVICIGFAGLHRYILQKENLLFRRIEQIVLLFVFAGFVVFLIILGKLVYEGQKQPEPKADYVIVLGAHVYGTRMSANLRYRIEAAYEYLLENPDTKVVLSGGQGHGEDITEAEAMRRFLVEKGISMERILMDDTSTNTEENIRNSAELIGDKEKKVIIVSNDFHVYRAKGIARKQGFENIEGMGSKTYGFTVPNCYAREVIAVLKYRICGQIS